MLKVYFVLDFQIRYFNLELGHLYMGTLGTLNWTLRLDLFDKENFELYSWLGFLKLSIYLDLGTHISEHGIEH